MTGLRHMTIEELEAGLEHIRQSPADMGRLELIVCRPRSEEREVLSEGELDQQQGLVGDCWRSRGSFETQVTIMNARAIALVAQHKDLWPLAGDQLFVDLDLSQENLPPGTRLTLGSAVIEVTAEPHNGCHKFKKRFGLDAVKFVNSPVGKQLHLRGINAKVVQCGTIRVGDMVKKV